MRRGITPVIAIIVLLFITIALAGTAWTYLQSFMLGYTGKIFSIPHQGAYCVDGTIRVYALNTGTLVLTTADFIIHEIDGTPVDLLNFTLAQAKPPQIPGGSDKILEADPYAPGSHTIRIGTAAKAEVLNVYC